MWYRGLVGLFWLYGVYGHTLSWNELNKINVLDIYLTWNEEPCSTLDVDSSATMKGNGAQVTANITWIYIKDSFDLILRVRDTPSDVCDVVIIDSSRKIFEHASSVLQTKEIAVFHWPSKERIWVDFTPTLQSHTCYHGSLREEAFKNTRQNNVTDNWKASSLIASIIEQTTTDNLFVIIQDINESNMYFEEASLDEVSTKYAIYHDLSSQTESGILQVLNNISNDMDEPSVCLVMCNSSSLETFLTKVDSVRNDMNTVLRHFSKWLVFADVRFKSIAQSAFGDIANTAFISISNDEGRTCRRQLALKGVIEAALYQLRCSRRDAPQMSIKNNFSVLFKMYVRGVSSRDITFGLETLPWHSGERRFAPVSYVSRENYTLLNPQLVFPNTRYGLNNRQLIITTIPWFTFTQKIETNDTVTYRGFCIDILDELARILNFSYIITPPPDQQWGSRGEGSNWTGMVGMLQRKEIDMVVAPLTMDKRRDEVMDFSVPFYYSVVRGMYRKPNLSKEKWKTLIKPFRYENYIVLSAVLLLACGMMFVIQKGEQFYKRKTVGKNSRPTILDVFFQLLGAMLNQGHSATLTSITWRTFMAFFWLFSIIIAALYSAALMSFLAVTKERIPFTTFNELLSQDEYKWGSVGGSIHVTSFSESNNDIVKQLWRGIQKFKEDDPSVLSDDYNEHMEKVMAGKYVFIAGWNDLVDFGCDLVTMEESLYRNYYAIGLQSNSPYKKIISKSLASMSESGVQKVLEKKWVRNKEVCRDSVKVESKPINIIDIQSAFYLLGLGLILSAFVLVSEVCISYCANRTRMTSTDESTRL